MTDVNTALADSSFAHIASACLNVIIAESPEIRDAVARLLEQRIPVSASVVDSEYLVFGETDELGVLGVLNGLCHTLGEKYVVASQHTQETGALLCFVPVLWSQVATAPEEEGANIDVSAEPVSEDCPATQT